jgi:diaminopimelate decarboxylase
MRSFGYRRGQLQANGVALEELARRFGTPLYVYDFDAVGAAYRAYARAFAGREHRVCFAVKANGNLALLERLAAWGSGFDVVSGGELARVRRAGGAADGIVFSGVGKTAAEMDGALGAGIALFQVESEPELELLAERASRRRRRARFGLRVNPDVAAATHPAIATGERGHKFGVAMEVAERLYLRSRRGAMGQWLQAEAIGFHIGSQILEAAPFALAARRVGELGAALERRGVKLRTLDAGGGLGIAYARGQRPPALGEYARALRQGWAGARERRLLLEPGRSLVAAAGALVARVLYVKRQGTRTYVIVDAGANDLLRPSLYGAYHEIVPLRRRAGRRRRVEVVGPICETGDAFAHERPLPPVRAGDGVALLDAGAYGFALSSNYNARPRAAEVALENGRARLIRRRERIEDLWRGE